MKRKNVISLVLAVLLLIGLLTACGKTVPFKVDFIVDGEVIHTIDTKGNEEIKLPADPEKEGYIFDGWYWDKDTWEKPFTANSLLDAPLSENMSVYAQWKVNQYSVTLNKNYSEAGTVSGQGNKNYDSSVTITAQSNSGYTWLGWYEGVTKVSTGDSLSYTFNMPASNKIFEARWGDYNITLEKNKDQDIIEDTDDPIIGDEDPIDDLIEYYTEAEYKQMSEAKIKEFVVELFDAKTPLPQYTINNVENLVVNFSDGNVYFNANNTLGNQNLFYTASLGEVITSATSYKSLHSNLKTAKIEDTTIKVDTRIANSIGEEKTIELNDYVLEQVGINKDNARVLNTSGFKSINGMGQLSMTVIDGSQIKVVNAATYALGTVNSVDAILAGREGNVLEVASSNSYLGEIVADTKVTSSRFSKVPFSKDIKDLIILASASICPGN